MWENEHKKIIIRNILIGLVLVLVVYGLLVTMKMVNQQIAEEDARLNAEQSSQRQELNEARQENLEALQNTYTHHLDTVEQYLPGIVCWGDSLTAGSSGNVSYPLTLQKYINTYLCDIYNIRYSLENPESYSRLNWEEYKISVPVVNMGAGQESSATILGRSGVQPYVVKNKFVIPAEKESVDISFTSPDGKAVNPLTAGNVGYNPVTIAGVEGTLTRVSPNNAWSKATYQFTRLEEGEKTEVPTGTEIFSSCEEVYKDYIHIVWMGAYGDDVKPAELVEHTKALLERQAANTGRYLVLGPCTIKGDWNNGTNKEMDAIDSAMLQAFGDRYINLRKYLVEDGLRDAGLGSTTGSNVDMRAGRVPSSFRSTASGADMNGIAYELIGKLVYERMDFLGYFDEVKEELKLEKITQDILNIDPKYFETRLN